MDAEALMALALEEARAAVGRTSPNPPVGAVVEKGGEVIARGRTEPAGGAHAEVMALRAAGEAARGATLYSTLEPCCHHGRTGPCTDAILAAGIAKVVIGCPDRNPRVCGKGIEILRAGGIAVEVGRLEAACEKVARPFFTWVETGRPYVVLKAAATLDGRIATRTGESRWITGEAARERVHGWRNRFDAILVGAGTVKADDPALTTRLPGGLGRDPIRVVLDGRLSTAPEARIYRQRSSAPTWVAATHGADRERAATLAALSNVEVLGLPGDGGRVSIPALLAELARRDVVSLLVEGGGEVHGAFLAAGVVDEVRLFIAPKLVGEGPAWLTTPEGLAPGRLAEAWGAESLDVETVGDDLLVTARL
jgi:diaminohydroxyphosphoribosylaminopyrimidine deaminase / 5-amino-6-(5-phosphoribosylamino)uracil reductase